MSNIIERAMQRLDGIPAQDREAEPPREPEPSVGRPQTISPARPVNGVAAPVESLARAPQADRAPAEQAPAAPVDSGAVSPAPASAADGSAVDLALDFERLGALNFLIPNHPNHQLADEMQHIKRRVLGNTVEGMSKSGKPMNLIMITSSVPGEGKTFTAINLALSLAMEMDRHVLAIDTDVLKADMTRMFGAHGRLGLFDVLSNKSLDIGGVMLRTNVPKLTFVPAGTVREVAAEKLASEMMRELTIELAQRYADRIVVFDCPPILATTGAVALAPHVGQILMVVEAWRTPQQTIKSAIQLMDQVEITGLVLNKTREKINKGKYYYYQYGYGYPQKTTPKEY